MAEHGLGSTICPKCGSKLSLVYIVGQYEQAAEKTLAEHECAIPK